METGKIVEWHKQEGDTVEIGDALFSMETDKATLDAESTEEGVLAKILVEAGTDGIEINALVGVIAEEGTDWKSVEIPTATDSPVSTPDEPTTAPPPSSSSSTSSTSSTSSSNATSSATSPPSTSSQVDLSSWSGFPSVRRLLTEYNLEPSAITPTGPKQRILKGDVLSYIESKGLQPIPQTRSTPSSSSSSSASSSSSPSPAAAASPASPEPTPTPQIIKKAPVIVAAVPAAAFTEIPASNMRKVISKRLTKTKFEVPHQYLTRTIDLTSLLALRSKLKQDGVRVSVNDFVVMAVSRALREVPEMNVQYEPESGEPVSQSSVDISIAVAIEGGLITPIIHNADTKSLRQISSQTKELAEKARTGKLTPPEYQGGTFAVSNLGMFGINSFTAVINDPQSGILAIGTSTQKPVFVDGKLTERTITSVTVSADARAIADETAAKFLASVNKLLENPTSLLL
eukprot:TRINITY_DN446_c0_g2_i2.p1 TRINITY_DN446_c0_g2~~TRINITY_DN446_c0_g2_i2.p1  ORF type:complete len:514 (+),score=178.20 TRINITY_DN446_c0_g2_i2:168-1544(+)